MTAPPAVSVVVPVRNVAPTVDDLVDRLHALIDPSGGLEVVIVDDASDDTTAEVLEAAIDRCGDARIRVLRREEQGGPTIARRAAYAVASAPWVWHADADDRWDPSIVATLHAAAVRTGADAVACRARRVEANGRTWTMEGSAQERMVASDEVLSLLLDGTVRGYLWNKLLPLAALLADEHPPLATQDDFLVVVSVLGAVRSVTLLGEVLYDYAETSGSVSTTRATDFANLDLCLDAVRSRFAPSASSAPTWGWLVFEARFVLVPAITTPIHQGWSDEEAEAVRLRYRPRLRWAHIRAAIQARDPRLAVHAAAIKALGPAFAPCYRSAGRIAGWSLTPR